MLVAQVVGRLEQRIKDLETQFDEEQRRLVDAERFPCKHLIHLRGLLVNISLISICTL